MTSTAAFLGVIMGSVTACGPDPTQNRLDHCRRHVASFFALWRNPMMVLRFFGPDCIAVMERRSKLTAAIQRRCQDLRKMKSILERLSSLRAGSLR